MSHDADCVFCDSNNFADRIIAENDSFWVIADIGQITDGGHVLVVPKQHVPCMGALSYGDVTALSEVVYRACDALTCEYSDLSSTSAPALIFEHGIVGQTVPHAHFQILPAGDLELEPEVAKLGAEIERLSYPEKLGELYHIKQEPYLFWTTPRGDMYVCWNPQDVPAQYFRTILAQMIGVPERANWRNIPDADANHARHQETVHRLKRHFKHNRL